MNRNNQYENILLIVTGASPQVLTETLYAIKKSGKAFPDRVIVITTKSTKPALMNGLFRDGRLEQLKTQYDFTNLSMSEEDIYLISDKDGRFLDKGKTEEDQEAMADFITSTVAELTNNKNCAIHASIAGGRKTMGFYLGYAMSLLGRSQDKLSHVFVNDEFEYVRDFWFPTKEDYWISGKNGQEEVNCKNAEITLAEIPFVRMRNSLDAKIIDSIINTSFCQQVSRLNQCFDQEFSLILNAKTKTLELLGIEVKLTPKEFSFYWWLYEEGEQGFLRNHKNYDDTGNSGKYLSYYIKISQDARTLKTFNAEELNVRAGDYQSINGIPNEWFEQNLSKINSKIDDKLSTDAANKIKIDSLWEEMGEIKVRRSMVNVYATNVIVEVIMPEQ